MNDLNKLTYRPKLPYCVTALLSSNGQLCFPRYFNLSLRVNALVLQVIQKGECHLGIHVFVKSVCSSRTDFQVHEFARMSIFGHSPVN